MTRKITGLVLIALIAITAVGWAVQYPLTVQSVSVEGNDEIWLRDILKAVHFEVGTVIEEEDLRTASQSIYDLGWFGEVGMDRDALEDGDVVFQVVENPVIREIVIEGNISRRDYRLFGIKLFDARIMPSYRVRTILWQNDVRKRDVLNGPGLMDGLKEVIAEYSDLGYLLVTIGDVERSEVLRIEFIEQKFSGNLIEGLATVPDTVAEEMIEIPLDEPLHMKDFSAAYSNLSQSVYFSTVEYEPQAGLEGDRFWLRWTLEERSLLAAPEAITAIEVEGNTMYPDEVLEDLIGEPPNRQINNYEFLELVKGVYDRYIRDGYMMVELSVSAIESGVLQLDIAEGEISQITVTGNTRTHDYVVERNSELEVGTVLNRSDLLVSYQQLTSLGYFGSLDLVPEWGEEGVEVTISVTEKSDLGGFGGSMAIDPSTGELFGELTLKEKNVFGTGQDLELSYSRGLVGTEDTKPSTWNLGYSTVAYFPGFDRVGVDFYQRSKEITVDEAPVVSVTLGGRVSFSYPVADYSNLGLSFRHEEEHMSNETTWTPADVINLSVAYDDTNDPFFPTQGDRRILSLEKAGGFSAGLEYTKFDLTWTHFLPATIPFFSPDLDQAVAIRIKAGWGDDQLPDSSRTDLGGGTSIRGLPSAPARQYVFSNVEYRLELTEGLYATAFWDGGFDLGAVRFEDLLSSFGFELGINAAGIIVRLDFVWALSEDFTWLPVFDFGFGQMF
ncbi:outer membrane protein assembly factor [Candidatus Bipolaricaulota bacterium]